MRFQSVRYIECAVMLLFVFLFSSCLGIESGIVINNDGSGTIDLVYTVSNDLNSLGEQDGNISQPPVPISKSDFEKTVSRIEGLSLKSYKSETAETNTLVTVKLDFDNLESLADYFDESGQAADYTETNGRKEMVFTFNENPAKVESAEQELFTNAMEGYVFDFSLRTQSTMEAFFVDQYGNPVQNVSGAFETKNNAVTYQVSMADLIFSQTPVILKIVF